MKIPFYQEVWNQVNLVDLAKRLQHPLTRLPDSKFYEAYYKEIFEKPEFLESVWKKGKACQSDWLKKQIDFRGGKKQQVLSLGAGTGIVEIPLIQAGYNIHLQECQKDSFNFFSANKLTECYYDLNEIQKESYDIVVSIAMLYALEDNNLNEIFRLCKSVLRKKGIFIILDAPFSWRDLYVLLRNKKYYQNNALFWGYKRNVDHFKQFSNKLRFIKSEHYGHDMQELNVKKIMGIPYNVVPHWQMVVYEND